MAVPRVRIHLPNIVFKLVHAPDLPPTQAAFRVPQNVNKLDIRQYLTKIYGLNIADVRTMNYAGNTLTMPGGRNSRIPKYKKAIVTLANGETFTWPAPPADEELAKVRLPNQRSIDSFGKNSMKKLFQDKDAKKKKPAADATDAAATTTSGAAAPPATTS
ncbi:hypothetical protein GGF32_001445 [Allomyces javanicus]|nr:hypothetical protein GGF32_001445 [Allomyces javanicus]